MLLVLVVMVRERHTKRNEIISYDKIDHKRDKQKRSCA